MAAADASSYADRGELAFRSGNYSQAAYDWRHALVDQPQNGTLGMMLAQALFATGDYDDAAGATQMAMGLLPQDQWGVVVKNYTDLYPNAGNFTTQLRALEKARNDKPEDPALRFLLGFQYNYLGYPQQAARELQKTVTLAPQDEMSRQLLGTIQGTSTGAPAVGAPPVPGT